MIPYLGCEAAREMLESFVDAELPMSEQVALEAHLRWCDTCRARVEDMRLIGSVVRCRAAVAATDHADAGRLTAVHDDVVMRVRTERDLSLSVRWRELFADMRYFWPALGATAAVLVCMCASTFVNQIVRTERPNSLAALISIMASPGSDQNPLHLESGMRFPRPLEVGSALDSILEEEVAYTVAAVVTREGRVSNYALLHSRREPLLNNRGESEAEEVSAVLDAVRHSRFEPAETAEGVVAVNMVWLLARTTVKPSAKAGELDGDGAIAPVPRTTLRPARS